MKANCILLLASLAISLLAVEIYLRVGSEFKPRERLIQLPLPGKDHHASLGQLVEESPVPRIGYQLRPGLETNFLGAKVITNEDGFQGDRCTKDVDTDLRIVGIGDSLMFGWGVGSASTYLEFLREKLTSTMDDKSLSVTNAAVPGYNTEQEVAVLRHRLIGCTPHIVILGFLESNDFELPHFLPSSQINVLDTLYTFRFLRRQTARIGKRGFRRAIHSLVALRDAYSFHLVVYAHEALSVSTLEHFTRSGITVLEGWPRVQHYLQTTGGGEAYTDSALVLSGSDPHPSVAGHELAADILFEHLSLELAKTTTTSNSFHR